MLSFIARLFVAFSLICSATAALAQGLPVGPRLIPYEGTLWDGGAPANGEYDFIFILCSTPDPAECTLADYDDPLDNWGASVLWVGTHAEADGYGVVVVAQGSFSVMLGETLDLGDTVLASSDLYLGMAVQPAGSPAGSFVELENRQRITPTPYVHSKLGSHDLVEIFEQRLVPAGAVMPFAGSSPPPGWLVCDGSAISRTTYADLYAVVGVAFGTGDGSTTFNLPDMRARFARGADGATPLGATGGSASHSHDLPDHAHSIDHDHPSQRTGGPIGVGGSWSADFANWALYNHTHDVDLDPIVATSGAGGADTISGPNVPPYVSLSYIIKH
jgi:microcystin-dependent protein